MTSTIVNYRWFTTRKSTVFNYCRFFLSFSCVFRKYWR